MRVCMNFFFFFDDAHPHVHTQKIKTHLLAFSVNQKIISSLGEATLVPDLHPSNL